MRALSRAGRLVAAVNGRNAYWRMRQRLLVFERNPSLWEGSHRKRCTESKTWPRVFSLILLSLRLVETGMSTLSLGERVVRPLGGLRRREPYPGRRMGSQTQIAQAGFALCAQVICQEVRESIWRGGMAPDQYTSLHEFFTRKLRPERGQSPRSPMRLWRLPMAWCANGRGLGGHAAGSEGLSLHPVRPAGR